MKAIKEKGKIKLIVDKCNGFKYINRDCQISVSCKELAILNLVNKGGKTIFW